MKILLPKMKSTEKLDWLRNKKSFLCLFAGAKYRTEGSIGFISFPKHLTTYYFKNLTENYKKKKGLSDSIWRWPSFFLTQLFSYLEVQDFHKYTPD